MRQIDVHKLADEARFNGFHGLVLFWCALIIIFDGYDLAVAGIALPSIMEEMGVDPTQAGLMVSSALFGMMFGAIFLGTIADRIGRRSTIVICIALVSWLADRFHIKYVLASMYALAAISITLLGYKMPTELLFVVVGLAGASTIGTQIVANAYTGQFYPMAIRATGLGWALGIGRSGAILAPILIGLLVGMSLPLQQNFIAIAIPAVLGMVAVLMIQHGRSASAHQVDVSAEIPDPPARVSVAG